MKKNLIIVFSLVLLILLLPSNVFAASVSTYGIEYCVQNNITTLCNTGTNGSFNYDYSNNRVNHLSFVTFNTNHDINVSAGDTVTLSALFWVTNDSINNLTEVYDLGPQLYGATANDFDIISIEPVDMTNTIFWSQNSQLDYYDISYQHLYIIRLQAKNNITREYWRLRWDIDLSYSTIASGTYRFRVNVSTGSPSNDYLILQAIQGISNAQQSTTNAIDSMNSNITDSSTNNDSDNQSVINNFNSKVASNNTISSLITMPITIFQKILNSVGSSCSPFTLGNLLGTNVVFPCINLANYIGNDLYNVIDVIISGLFIFSISKTMIKVFNNFTSLKDKGDILGGVD